MTDDIKSPLRLAAEHSTALVASVYLFSAFVGTTYHLFLFRYFELSVFDFWEGADYLVAAVREPRVVLLGFLAVVVAGSVIWNKQIDAWARTQGRVTHFILGNVIWEKIGFRLAMHPVFGISLGLGFFLLLAWDVANGHAKAVESGIERRVIVYPSPEGADALRGNLLSKTSNFLIVISAKTGAVYALTLEGLNGMKLCGDDSWDECDPDPAPSVEEPDAGEASGPPERGTEG